MKLIAPPDVPYKELKLLNFYRRASSTWKQQNYIHPKTHKVTTKKQLDWEVPWDFVNQSEERNAHCQHCMDLFDMYNMVPPYCLGCWKVVVKPRKHSELIALRNMMREMATEDPEVYCKCGIELRSYSPGLYGGYFYTTSKEAGLKRLRQVRKRINDEILLLHEADAIPVYLKRYCTEYEHGLGDTAKYESPEYAEDVQKFYLSHMADRDFSGGQPAIIKMEVYQGWIDWGWKFGTPEDRKEIEDTCNDGEPLYPKPRTYEHI